MNNCKFICFIAAFVIAISCDSGKKKPVAKEQNVLSSTKQAKASVIEKSIPALTAGESKVDENIFGTIKDLKGKHHIVKDEILIPNQLIVKGDYLIIRNQKKKSGVFSVLSLPDFRHVKSFGVIGKGPGEFGYPQMVETDEKDKLFYIYEGIGDKLYYVDKNFNVKSLNIFRNKGGWSNKHLHVENENSIFYVDNTKKGKSVFRVSDQKSKELNNLAYRKGVTGWSAYIGDFGVNTKYKRMVYAYKFRKQLKFMSLDGQTVHWLKFKTKKRHRKGSVKSMMGPQNVTHYWGMSTTNDNVYSLYSGRTPIQIGNDWKKNIEYIFVEKFDWNGKPIKKFKLDKWGYFCVDKKRNKLYIGSVREEHPIYSYDI